MFNVFVYDENGDLIKVIRNVKHYKNLAVKLVSENFSVRVYDAVDKTMVYSLDCVL